MAAPISIGVLDQTIKRVSSLEKLAAQGLLHDGDGGGTSSGMESRVTKLETHMEYVRSDLSEIKTSLKKLDDLPTKRDLTTNTLTVVVIGLAVMAVTIGGIVGGLAWIDRAGGASPAPAVATAQR